MVSRDDYDQRRDARHRVVSVIRDWTRVGAGTGPGVVGGFSLAFDDTEISFQFAETREQFTMIAIIWVLLSAPSTPSATSSRAPQDTIRIEVGSKQVNGRVYSPHAARVRVRIGPSDAPIVSEWTNELALGDSGGRPVMRWVTKGTRQGANGATVTWELRQTYDAETLAPYGYHSTASTGALTWSMARCRCLTGRCSG